MGYRPEQVVIIYSKYRATYISKDPTDDSRHKITMLEGPDKGRTVTCPGDRIRKA